MTEQDKKELRTARNRYNSSLIEAQGYSSGKRIYNLKHDERRLRNLLWEHREYIVNQLTTTI